MTVNDMELIKLAEDAGFRVALIPTREIPVDGSFRKFCEDNLCGKYNANYSCPPACGTVEELNEKMLAEEKALVVETIWEIESYENKTAVNHARITHNKAVMHLTEQIREAGYTGFCLGYNGCPLCNPCKQVEDKPCAFPEKKISCMSAYCIDVAKLAKKCELPFAWSNEKLYLFGLIAFHKKV